MLTKLAPVVELERAQQNYAALLFHPIDHGVIVVWSFGSAWSLLDKRATIERFGLKAGLNALLTSAPAAGKNQGRVGVRSLTSAVRAVVIRQSTVLAARPSKPTSMERVDQSADAAAMAELTTDHPVFNRISAGKSLRFQASIASLDDLANHAREAYRLYQRDDYSRDEGYQWIDHTVPVGDPAEVDAVLDELLRQSTSATPIEVDIVWVEADHETGVVPAYVCFPGERSGPGSSHRTELTWSGARSWLQSKGLASGTDLGARLRFYDDDDQVAEEVELWELLVAQLSYGGQTYFVSDGAVWRISASFIANVDKLLAEQVTVNPTWLPPYQSGEKEGIYNARAAQHHGHLLLDKDLVRLPGQTSFEPCDLMSADGRLMHVKRKSRSSGMSHLVAQALGATQLLRSDSAARDLVCKAIAADQSLPGPSLAAMQAHVRSFGGSSSAKVSLVIVGTWHGTPTITQLPLLTRISLHGWLRQMPCERGIILVGQ